MTVGLSLLGAVLTAPPASAQVVPVARTASGGSGLDIWVANESDGTAQLAIPAVDFRPLELVGYAVRDRLRLDLPTPHGEGSPAEFVRLPQGGRVFRVASSGSTGLLVVAPDGSPSLRAMVPDVGEPGLIDRIAVRSDGRAALVTTAQAAGGDVGLIDLDTTQPATWLTAALPPLDVDAESLRVSALGAWFVADGELFRADLGAGTTAELVDLGLPAGTRVLPELLLCDQGHRVAALVEVEGENELARIVVVPVAGPTILVTQDAGEYDAPNLEHPLGPFMALNEDGTLVAYRQPLGTLELFVASVEPVEPPLHLTAEPTFPAYIDNVGVLNFAGHVLTFFAGDVQISGVDLEEMIGAGDMFRADVGPGNAVSFTNVTASGGVVEPPYTQPGTLQFSDALLDPLGQRYVLVGESPSDDTTITIVDDTVDTYAGAPLTVLDGLAEDPSLHAAGQSVVIHSEGGDESDESVPGALHLLRSLHVGDPALVLVATLPAGVALDRFAASGTGDRAACVASAGAALQLPVLISLPDGMPALMWPFPLGVSPLLSFSPSGQLCLGLGAPGGPFKFGLLAPGPTGVAVKIPAGGGFPLPR